MKKMFLSLALMVVTATTALADGAVVYGVDGAVVYGVDGAVVYGIDGAVVYGIVSTVANLTGIVI